MIAADDALNAGFADRTGLPEFTMDAELGAEGSDLASFGEAAGAIAIETEFLHKSDDPVGEDDAGGELELGLFF